MVGSARYDASVASKYDSLRSWGDKVLAGVARRAAIGATSRVLDVGCGTGNLVAGVHRIRPCRFVGIDLSREMLRVAADKVRDASFVQADVTALPLRDGTFDNVIGAFFMHHVPAGLQPTAIAECCRVIACGTLVVVTVSHEQIERSQVGRFFPEIVELDKKRFPPIERLRNWLRETGFRDVRSETVMDNPIRLGRDYLAKVEHRHISTFDLIGVDAYERGLAAMREYVRGLEGTDEVHARPVTIVYGTKNR